VSIVSNDSRDLPAKNDEKSDVVGKEKGENRNVAQVAIEPMSIGYRSHIGMVRSLNEDSVAVVDFSGFYASPSKDLRKVLAIVADGIGGHFYGQVASSEAVATIAEELSRLLPKTNVEAKDYEDALRMSFVKADRAIMMIHDDHICTDYCKGAGTTVSAVIIDGIQLYVGHVGDTRVYVIGKDGISQVTKDHSLVQELVDRGEITPEEARKHPQKNVITRAVGINVRDSNQVDVYYRVLKEGDYVLLCSDGLVTEVEDQEIMRTVLELKNPQKICDELIRLANERGGRDNISVVVIGPISITRFREVEVTPETEVKSAIGIPSPIPSEPQASSTASHVKFCPECGHPNTLSARRCSICKAELED
jgi:protein phosphatase